MKLDAATLATSPLQKSSSLLCKRLFDIFFSLSVLVFCSPLFLLITLVIRFSSPGKAIYTQDRLGKGGKPFKCFKFRTMVTDADEILEELLKRSPRLRQEWNQNQKLKKDPRVFSIGRFLRKTSLDELPQFWNVLKGDLSVVGPRPYMLNQQEDLGTLKYKILSMRPGITGVWQTSGRSKTTFKERMLLDSKYIDDQGFFFDLYLIAKTIPSMVLAKDAY